MTIIIFLSVLVIALAFITLKFPKFVNVANVVVLGFTAIILIWNTIEVDRGVTRTLEQNWKINLRPIILPSINWPSSSNDYYQQQLKNGSGTIWFNIHDNIATNINGYIVANHQQTKLGFMRGSTTTFNMFTCNTNPPLEAVSGGIVTWIPPAWGLCGYFDFSKNPPTTTSTDNEIYVQYEDIDGRQYFTKAINSSINSGSLSDD